MRKIFFLAFILALSISGCSLASDITPPPGYLPPTAAQQPTAASVSFPVVPPDPSQGASIYLEKCAPCHGTTGMGNGPQASQLPNPVPPLGTVGRARQAKPVDWYNMITNGNVQRYMPGFKSLSDRQRWDVVAYVYTLSAPQTLIQQGKAIYEEKCQSCHGAQGKGNASSAKAPDWTDPSRLAQRSAQGLFQVISGGSAPNMPAYASQLSEDQRWAAAAYIRSLTFTSGGSAVASANPAPTAGSTASAPTGQPPAQTPAANPTTQAVLTPAAGRAVISGKVINQSKSTLPADLKVTLQGYDSMSPTWSATAPVAADGNYRFENVDVLDGRVYLIQVVYQNVPYSSDPLHAADLTAGKELTANITIAETSSDASVLHGQRLHVFFDFTIPGSLQVAELFIIQNPTDKAIVPATAAGPILAFELPSGATNLQFQDGDLGDGRYIKTDKGFGDAQAITPQGVVQILFAYELPYPNNSQTLVLTMPVPVDSAILMVPAGGVTLQGSQLVSMGTRTVESTDISMYTASNLASGAKLALTISGMPLNQTSHGTAQTSGNSTTGLIIGLGVFGAALVAGGAWLLRQRRENTVEELDDSEEEVEEETSESVLDAIVALDDLYQAGSLPEEAYRERRAELKNKLRSLRGS